MASTYCKVSFNWKSDCDENKTIERTTNVVKYSFIDIESSDFDNISFENRVNAHDKISLQFHKHGNDDGFVTSITCNNPEFSQIDGISIESESRTLEISHDKEGYIKTVKGRKLVQDSEGTDTNHFVCTCSFEKPYSSLSIKLLSLGSKESVSINSIAINIRQHNLDHSASKGTFDMTRLKKDIEEMGDSVSDKALDFLATMENFEKNKLSSFGLFAQNAMMSMQSPGAQDGLSSIMRSVLGDENMRNLEEDTSQGCEEDDDDQGNIYNMLQAICGQVTATRASQKPTLEGLPEDGDLDHLSAGMNRMNGQIQDVGGSVMFGILTQKLEEAKQDMRGEIQAVKNEVMSHIDDMKREMMEQMNNITVILQGLQATARNSHCVEDE